MRKYIVLATTLIALLVAGAGISAQDSEPDYRGELRLGSHYTGVSEYYKKVAEYDRGRDGMLPDFGFRFDSRYRSGYLGLSGDYYDPRRHGFELVSRYQELFQFRGGYRTFFRNQATDNLNNISAREALDTAWSVPGGKMLTHEDKNPGIDYGLTRREINASVEVRPTPKWDLRMVAAHRTIIEKGTEQATATNHCFSCHITSQAVAAERRTHFYSGGIEVSPGPVTLGYDYRYRTFKSLVRGATVFYDQARHPVSGAMVAEFGSRVAFDNREVTYYIFPEVNKSAHTFKASADILGGLLSGSFTTSKAKNNDAGLELTGNGGVVRYFVRPGKRSTLNITASIHRVENDTVFIDLPDWREGRPGGGQNFDYTRYSSLTRTVGKGTVQWKYRPSRKYNIALMAGMESVKRDDYPYRGADYETKTYSFEGSLKYRPESRYQIGLKYHLDKTSDPFISFGKLLERNGSATLTPLPGNTQVFYFQRDALRYGNISNQPELSHQADFTLAYKISERASLSAGVKLLLEKNNNLDSLEYEHEMFQPNFSLNLTPHPRWAMSAGYSYYSDRSNGPLAVAMMDG